MAMANSDPEREERRRQQKEIADSLKESGALDDIFARIDAGEPLTGHEGLLKGMLKASLERGMDVELSDHVGYDRGDPDASMFGNSRNGTFPKTVATEIGDVELAIPRDRNGTFTPMLVPKGSRRLDAENPMAVSVIGSTSCRRSTLTLGTLSIRRFGVNSSLGMPSCDNRSFCWSDSNNRRVVENALGRYSTLKE